MRTRVLSAGIVFSIVLVALSGCWSFSAEDKAIAHISAEVTKIKDGFSKEVERTSPGSQLNFENVPVHDLRSLTDEETRRVGWPVSGFYEFDSDQGGFDLTIVVVGIGNEGGFSNADRTYYSCLRLEAVPGSAEIDVVDLDCPTSLLEQFSVLGTPVRSSQLDLEDHPV